jgi:hypothetical protein
MTFLGYMRDIWRNLRFLLISVVNFYYGINKSIMLLPDRTNLVFVYHLKYLSIVTSLF